MAKTRLLVIPQSRRISTEDFFAITEKAGRLSKIIRDWFPTDGDSASKASNPRTAEEWFSHGAKLYEECESIRNPNYMPFDGKGLTMGRGYSFEMSSEAVPYCGELCSTLGETALQFGS